MKKSIDIKGITTTSAYTDGDCRSVVNLRKKNGVLKPVTPRRTIKTLTAKYDVLFVHQLPSTGENWIGVRGGYMYYIENTGLPGETEHAICPINSVPTITQIGNVLNVLDTTGLQYVIWYENAYKVINTNFDGNQTDTVLGPVKVDIKVDGYASGSARKTLNFYSDTDVTVGTPHDTKQEMCAGLFAKAKSYDDSQGRLSGFVMACIALELYDGSFILHSNPILLGQAYDEKTRYTSANIPSHDYISIPAVYYSPGAVSWDEVTTNADGYYEKVTNDIITGTSASDDVLTSYFPNVFCSDYFLKIDGGGTVKRMVCRKSSNVLKIRINNTISQDYKTLVKSVCVFITQQVTGQDYKVTEYKGYFDYNGTTANRAENYFGKPKSNEDILKELKSNQQFYKVKEIPFDEIVAGDWIDLTEDLKGKLGDNLVSQEELKIDNFTHHTLLPQKQMVYNSKLHAMDYKMLLSRGWPLSYFQANQGIGQFTAITTDVAGTGWIIEVDIKTATGISTVVRYQPAFSIPVSLVVPFASMLSYPDSRAIKMRITRAIYTSGIGWNSNTTEYNLTSSSSQNYAYYLEPNLKPILLSEYPDSPSIPLVIPAENQREQIFRNGMKISSVNNPFYFPDENTILVGTGIIRNAGTNAIRMSEGQFGQYDLYVFTSEGIYSLDTGTNVTYNRISPASLELPISGIICSTPFGVVFIGKRGLFIINGQQVDFLTPQLEQEPLSLSLNMPTSAQVATIGSIKTWNDWFKTFLQGVTEIVYDNQHNEIIIINASYDYNFVYNLDSKEVYQQTEKIDKVVQNKYPELNVTEQIDITVPVNVDIITLYGIEYLYKGYFDYSKTYSINEVVRFQENVYISEINGNIGHEPYDSMWTNAGSSFVIATRPTGTTQKPVDSIKDYSLSDNTPAQVSFITRPFNFGITEIKKLERTILRARLNLSENIIAMNHCSNDGVNFVPVQGKTLINGNYRDIDLGMMVRNKHRQFIYAFAAKLDEDSQIGQIDCEVVVEYGNEKMR